MTQFQKKVPFQLLDVERGRHEDELDASRVCVDELLAEQHHEVKVLFAVVDLVQDDVRVLGEAPERKCEIFIFGHFKISGTF
jgi:hypothetical protein